MKRKLFGTDGVRGVANKEPMTAETALKLGRVAGHLFRRHDHHHHRIVIGKDTRLSGYMIESALAAGLCSMGVDVLLIGPIPTPGISFITRTLRADAGIMLSASHNSFEDNGIKFFSNTGHKLPDAIEDEMERLFFSGEIDHVRPTAREVGKAYRIEDALGRYVEFVKNSFPKGMTLDGMKIVLDCANGAAYKVAPEVYQELGAHLAVLNAKPDGTNINKNCGSLYPEGMVRQTVAQGADVGVAHDGDADRVILADEKGALVDGDEIMAICALDLLQRKELRKNTLVATVMSNMGLEVTIQKAGAHLVRTKVGDRYVLDEMLRLGANLGGEQSGHILFSDYTTTGDGLITALQVLRILQTKGQPLSQLRRVMKRYPQVLHNVDVAKKPSFDTVPAVHKEIQRIQKELNGTGRLLVRYSGTELIARVMIEGENKKKIDAMARGLASLIEKHLGA